MLSSVLVEERNDDGGSTFSIKWKNALSREPKSYIPLSRRGLLALAALLGFAGTPIYPLWVIETVCGISAVSGRRCMDALIYSSNIASILHPVPTPVLYLRNLKHLCFFSTKQKKHSPYSSREPSLVQPPGNPTKNIARSTIFLEKDLESFSMFYGAVCHWRVGSKASERTWILAFLFLGFQSFQTDVTIVSNFCKRAWVIRWIHISLCATITNGPFIFRFIWKFLSAM